MTVAQIPTDNGIFGVENVKRRGRVVGIRVTKGAQRHVIRYDSLPTPKYPEDRVDVQEQLQVALEAALGVGIRVYVQSLTPPIVRVR